MTILVLLPIAGGLSYFLTLKLIDYAIAHRVVDIPKDRSSHKEVTPRGGGMAIAVTFLTCLSILWATGDASANLLIAMLGSGGLVASVGFIDDHRSVPASLRLLVHFVAAGWVVFYVGGLPVSSAFGVMFLSDWLGTALGMVYIVWLLNLYNFMDGIDALAGVEAVTVCAGGVLLYFLAAPSDYPWEVPALLAASVAGFLCLNLPPARIFMGDAGSGFVGVSLAIISLQAGWIEPDLFWAWCILLSVFVVDATVTLITRGVRGERLSQAHRTHAYQRAARTIGSHLAVSVSVGVINLLWALPIAALVVRGHLSGGSGLLLSYVPLVLGALMLSAGRSEKD